MPKSPLLLPFLGRLAPERRSRQRPYRHHLSVSGRRSRRGFHGRVRRVGPVVEGVDFVLGGGLVKYALDGEEKQNYGELPGWGYPIALGNQSKWLKGTQILLSNSQAGPGTSRKNFLATTYKPFFKALYNQIRLKVSQFNR